MKKIVFLTCCLMICSACQSTDSKTEQVETEMVLGSITAAELLQNDARFELEYQQYQPSEQELLAMQSLQGKRLMVLFGAWCHDSQREVPRLLKLIDNSGVTLDKLELIGVNYKKTDPQGLAAVHQLRYTPTFILFDGDEELGRMVERPEVSIAADLSKIGAK